VGFDTRVPRIIRWGAGTSAQILDLLKQLGGPRPLIVTDRRLLETEMISSFVAVLSKEGAAVYGDVLPDPTDKEVAKGVAAYRSGGHDSLVSIGGGSSIDTAKAIGILIANGGEIRDYKAPAAIPNAGPPHIAIPTTAGTGSEVTSFTVISDTTNQEKMLIAGAHLVPTAAIIDYELTLSMPKRLTADTGTDSLTHALEAYVSRKANPISDLFARDAMKIIWEWLPTAYREPANHIAREKMMMAATVAGMAFSNASVALVHGMSRPLGFFFHIPHGLSNAMLLPAVTRFSIPGAPGRYAECAKVMGIAGSENADLQAATELVDALFQRNQELEVPSPREYGIAEREYFRLVPTMIEQALASGSPQNNPRIPTQQEIGELYREVWNSHQ